MAAYRLVFLHIPKTAGSSMRAIVSRVYRTEQIHWFSDEDAQSSLQPFCEQSVTDKLFLGGHRPLNFYPPRASHLYFATLRHPVERVRSLFSYYTRPEEGGSEGNVAERGRLRAQLLGQGIVPESLSLSIQRCKPFRRAIENEQCRYLSAGAPTFAAVQETLAQGNFLIGNSMHLGSLLGTLGTLFQWPETKEVRTNISVSQGEDDILSEPGVVEQILECCAEDVKLYDHVQQRHGGLFVNLPDRDALLSSDLYFADAAQRRFSDLAWIKLRLSLVGPGGEVRPGRSVVMLRLHNDSREFLNPELGDRIAVSYVLLDERGEIIERATPRSPIQEIVPPGESLDVQVRLVIADDLPCPAVSVRFSVVVEKRFWLYRLAPDHGLELPVVQGA